MFVTDRKQYPNFSAHEFNCKHTGRNRMQAHFIERLQRLRTEYGRPIIITSGYRDPTHPVEAKKARPGMHSHGIASDIQCNGPECHRILQLALKHGFTGIGIQQKGNGRFIHLDLRETEPTVWSY